MPTTPLVWLPEGLEITSVSETTEDLLVRVTSNRSCSLCPLCSTPSDAIHSYYRRKPADLPCAGRPIRLLLTVRKFFCRNAACPRKVFTERLPELLEPASRLTTRLREALQTIGFALNGEGGARLACRLGMPISATTLLRSLHLVPTPPVGKVRVVGLDDWAWRKGHRYGTIIIDQERHVVIDLLAERSAESVQKWLEAHPEVEIVSRDRGGTYVWIPNGFCSNSGEVLRSHERKGLCIHQRHSQEVLQRFTEQEGSLAVVLELDVPQYATHR